MNQPTRTNLTGGIRLIVLPTAGEIVALRAFWLGGASLETPQTQGLAHLVGAVLPKGCAGLTSQDIAGKVEAVGASLGTDTHPDYFLLGLSCLKPDFAGLLALVAQLLREPDFPEIEVELERKNTLLAIRSQQERPFTVAYNHLRPQLYGADHPYSFLDLGSAETVAALTRENLQTFHRESCVPERLVLCISGDLEPDTVLALVEQYFGDWRAVPCPLPVLTAVQGQQSRQFLPQDTQQSTLLLGYPTVGIHHPDHPVLKLISTYLGSGLSSRLFVELREKQGLAYEVSALTPTRLGPSHFITYIGTSPQNLAIAEDGLRSEALRLAHTPLTPDELRVAQNKLLGQYALGKQSSAQVARLWGIYEVLGLGLDYDQQYAPRVKAITTEEVQRVASQYFTPGPTVTIVGPSEPALLNLTKPHLS
ncbi:pitrilysin family protein [Candidatus Cyanaurora vandensis]|uniref:M16 family metallopeptidase n=1 Tax=Candidatus Cyanaurora vandensis TaxID=2714958 RepID=UPI00257F97B5|nr:pitrilysin family protein [Candidatus Cyanaurora vandensis]